jgi:hypothetical protein
VGIFDFPVFLCGSGFEFASSRHKQASNPAEAPMPQDPHQSLREHLVALLTGGQAHSTFEDAIKDLPAKLRGTKPENFPHSPWMLLEHLRIAQHDILEFSRNKKHESPKWPEGYWPESPEPPSAGAWTKSVNQFNSDVKAMQDLVMSPKTDLFTKIPWGDGQTVLREALLVADHNAYHIAQIVDVRRLLGAWS